MNDRTYLRNKWRRKIISLRTILFARSLKIVLLYNWMKIEKKKNMNLTLSNNFQQPPIVAETKMIFIPFRFYQEYKFFSQFRGKNRPFMKIETIQCLQRKQSTNIGYNSERRRLNSAFWSGGYTELCTSTIIWIQSERGGFLFGWH